MGRRSICQQVGVEKRGLKRNGVHPPPRFVPHTPPPPVLPIPSTSFTSVLCQQFADPHTALRPRQSRLRLPQLCQLKYLISTSVPSPCCCSLSIVGNKARSNPHGTPHGNRAPCCATRRHTALRGTTYTTHGATRHCTAPHGATER
eukprot:gene11368-biopygen4438